MREANFKYIMVQYLMQTHILAEYLLLFYYFIAKL